MADAPTRAELDALFVDAWQAWLLEQPVYEEDAPSPDERLPQPFRDLFLQSLRRRSPTLRLGEWVFGGPKTAEDLDKLARGKSIKLGYNLDDDFDLKLRLEGDALVLAGGEPLTGFVARVARKAYEPPSHFVRARMLEIIGRDWLGTRYDQRCASAGKDAADGLAFAPVRDLDVPSPLAPLGEAGVEVRREEAGDVLIVAGAEVDLPSPRRYAEAFAISPEGRELGVTSPFKARRVDLRTGEAKVALEGWWMTDLAFLADGALAVLTEYGDKQVDRTDPDAATLTRLKELPGGDTIEVPSNGVLHIVDAKGSYRVAMSVQAERVDSVCGGRFVILRKLNDKTTGWGTVVLACRDGKLAPVLKLGVDIGRVFEREGRVFGAHGFELLGLEGELTRERRAWQAERIEDSFRLEPAPPPPPDAIDAEDGPLKLVSTTAARPDQGEAPQAARDAFAWVSDDALEGTHLVGTQGGEGLWDYDLWRDGETIALEALHTKARIGYAFDEATASVLVGCGPTLWRFTLADGDATRLLELGGSFRDLVIAGDTAWAMLGVHKAESDVVRLERTVDGWAERDRFPVTGLDTLSSAGDGKVVALTVDNAMKELAYTLFVAADGDTHRYLGRIRQWSRAMWTDPQGALVIETGDGGVYELQQTTRALQTAQARPEGPFLALVWDVPGHYGKREFLARHGADWGYIDEGGQLISGWRYTSAIDFEGGRGRAAHQGTRLFGLVNPDGSTALPHHYAWISEADPETGARALGVGDPDILGRYPKGCVWGLANGAGEVVLPCDNEIVRTPAGGLAAVKRADGRWTFVGPDGRARTPLTFEACGNFCEGFAPVQIGGKWGLLNAQGELVVEPRWDGAGEVRDGIFGVQIDGKWGFANTLGEVLSDERFDQFFWHSNGFAVVRRGDRWGHVDTRGQLLGGDLPYARTFSFHGRIAPVTLVGKNKRMSYINADGELLSEKGWTETFTPMGGIGVFATPTRRGYVLDDGRVLARRLEDAFGFSEGLGPFCKDGLWGYMNVDGEVVIEPRFEFAGNFHEGRADVKLGGRWGFIDTSGELVIPPRYAEVGKWSGGHARVRKPRS